MKDASANQLIVTYVEGWKLGLTVRSNGDKILKMR